MKDLLKESDNRFNLDVYLKGCNASNEIKYIPDVELGKNGRFQQICEMVRKSFDKEWNESKSTPEEKEAKLEKEKNAIIGKAAEVSYFKDKIRDCLRILGIKGEWYPTYYDNLVDAIFHENWGVAGIAPWVYDVTEELRKSSSAKIIGENIFFFINGEMQLQKQKISSDRRNQLKKALLLKTEKERLNEGFHEVYMERGNIRITIYSGDRTKEDQDIFVFRKYVMNELSFERMAELETIPHKAIALFKAMIEIGYNVIFTGAVRTGKSTFLTTWQKYENPILEGLTIATDPEISWDKIMPGAPIMQLVADGEKLEKIIKSILRSDADYIVLEEARAANAFNLGLDVVTAGTRHSKMTMHANRAYDIPYKMGSKIVAEYGGDLNAIISQIFLNWNYVFEFMQVEGRRSSKKLTGISEFRYDIFKDEVSIHRICDYDIEADSWQWKYDIGEDKTKEGKKVPEAFNIMKETLKELEKENPMKGQSIIVPAYYHKI